MVPLLVSIRKSLHFNVSDTLWTDYIKLLTKTTGGQHQGQSRGQPDNLLGFALDGVM